MAKTRFANGRPYVFGTFGRGGHYNHVHFSIARDGDA